MSCRTYLPHIIFEKEKDNMIKKSSVKTMYMCKKRMQITKKDMEKYFGVLDIVYLLVFGMMRV